MPVNRDEQVPSGTPRWQLEREQAKLRRQFLTMQLVMDLEAHSAETEMECQILVDGAEPTFRPITTDEARRRADEVVEQLRIVEAQLVGHNTKGRPSVKYVTLRPFADEKAWEKAVKAAKRSYSLMEVASLFLPARVAEEELGDALEDVSRLIGQGHPAWRIYARTLSAIIWATWNTIKGWRPARDKKGT